MNPIDKQLNTLTKWVTVELKPSPVHGVGVFAVRDLKAGEQLFMNIMPFPFKVPYKKLTNNVPSYVHDTLIDRWPHIKDGEVFVYPDARYVAYCNHSNEPNYDALTDVALRDIEKGEEIFEDYRKIKGWEDIYPFIK